MSVNRVQAVSLDTKESLLKFAEDLIGRQLKDTAIKKITVKALSRRLRRLIDSDICVGGELSPDLSGTPHEPVAAIFESDAYPSVVRTEGGFAYLVVTPGKDTTGKGTVYFFQPSEVTSVERE